MLVGGNQVTETRERRGFRGEWGSIGLADRVVVCADKTKGNVTQHGHGLRGFGI